MYFETLIDPFEPEGIVESSEESIRRSRSRPTSGSGWYGYTYKTHLLGAQSYWRHLESPKKLLFTGPAHLERPFHGLHGEMLRWYDHWLKGIDTGVMDEPPVRYWVMGANEWRTADGLAAAGGRVDEALSDQLGASAHPSRSLPSSVDDLVPPDTFAQMPLTHTNRVQKLRYLSEPLPRMFSSRARRPCTCGLPSISPTPIGSSR